MPILGFPFHGRQNHLDQTKRSRSTEDVVNIIEMAMHILRPFLERVGLKKITLKYDGKCTKCGRTISAGKEAYWEKDEGVWHLECDSRVREKGYTASRGLWVAVTAIVVLAFVLGGLVLGPLLVPHPTVTLTTTVTTTTTEHFTITITATTSGATTAAGQKWINPSDPNVINWADAGKYVGQTKTVEGTVVRAYRSANAIFLDFHDPYQGYFMVVIFKSDWTNFKFQPEIFYKNKEVRVTGLIKTYQGSPEIIASSPTQIEVAFMGFNYPRDWLQIFWNSDSYLDAASTESITCLLYTSDAADE